MKRFIFLCFLLFCEYQEFPKEGITLKGAIKFSDSYVNIPIIFTHQETLYLFLYSENGSGFMQIYSLKNDPTSPDILKEDTLYPFSFIDEYEYFYPFLVYVSWEYRECYEESLELRVLNLERISFPGVFVLKDTSVYFKIKENFIYVLHGHRYLKIFNIDETGGLTLIGDDTLSIYASGLDVYKNNLLIWGIEDTVFPLKEKIFIYDISENIPTLKREYTVENLSIRYAGIYKDFLILFDEKGPDKFLVELYNMYDSLVLKKELIELTSVFEDIEEVKFYKEENSLYFMVKGYPLRILYELTQSLECKEYTLDAERLAFYNNFIYAYIYDRRYYGDEEIHCVLIFEKEE